MPSCSSLISPVNWGAEIGGMGMMQMCISGRYHKLGALVLDLLEVLNDIHLLLYTLIFKVGLYW